MNKILKEFLKSDFHSGDRPIFLYSKEEIIKNLKTAKSICSKISGNPSSKVFFSLKSNPNKIILNTIMEYFDGVDVSSLRELEVAIERNVNITISGPAKTDALLERAKSKLVNAIHIDSAEEAEIISKNLETSSSKTTYSLRLNVDQNSPKLGLELEAIKCILSKYNFIKGIHFYLGREQFDRERMKNILEKINLLNSNGQIENLYIGLGLSGIDLSNVEYFDTIEDLKKYNCTFEMGRVVLETSAFYLAKVLSVKKSEQYSLIVNGGVQHIAASLIDFRRRTPVLSGFINLSRQIVAGKEEANIFGSLCLGTDLLIKADNFSQEICRGCWVYFYPCGAYNISASPSEFILQDRPIVLMSDHGVLIDITTG